MCHNNFKSRCNCCYVIDEAEVVSLSDPGPIIVCLVSHSVRVCFANKVEVCRFVKVVTWYNNVVTDIHLSLANQAKLKFDQVLEAC